VLEHGQVSTALGDFVMLRLIRECALGPLEASTLGSKTSSPYGKISLKVSLKVRHPGPNHICNIR